MDAAAQESFKEFVASRSSALLKTAVLLSGGDRHTAEDLLQNALIKVAGHWNRIEEPEAYVRRVLYRQQVSRWRLKWPRRELSVAETPEAGPGADPASAAELRLVMRGALARLTARQRAVLVLRYFEDLPEADVARILGLLRGNRAVHHTPLAGPPAHPRPRTRRAGPGRRRTAAVPRPTLPWRCVRERRSAGVRRLPRAGRGQCAAPPYFAERVLAVRRRRRARRLACAAAAAVVAIAVAVGVPLSAEAGRTSGPRAR